MKICKTCQQQLSDEFVYCPKCGSELILDNHIICSKCNRSVDKEFAFCPYCGNKIISSNTILEKSYTIAGFFGSVLKAFPLPLPKVYVSLFYKCVQI